ncbi:MAG: hydantoinase/oxoprolinase family protein, partial [Rhodospirillaceae bacterium]|nr:hydantoinase/oxoprolinase family protein [Rhodospirillaceae bacterium]
CYGRGGTSATVTDAALILGYIDPGYFLGGSMPLDMVRAHEVMLRDVGAPLGLDLHQSAAAVIAVMTENMVAAIEDVTVNQGIDPRDALLVGGGGAAGLNAVKIARRLGCTKVIIPDVGAALSAAGGHLSDLGTEFAKLHVTSCSRFDYAGVNRTPASLNDQCEQFVADTGLPVFDQRIEFFVEARYAEQIWEIEVPLSTSEFSAQNEIDALAEEFHKIHRELFASMTENQR